MTWIGAVLTLTSAIAGLAALVTMRGERCPSCATLGALDTIASGASEIPGLTLVVTRMRACRECGARVEDVYPIDEGPSAPFVSRVFAR